MGTVDCPRRGGAGGFVDPTCSSEGLKAWEEGRRTDGAHPQDIIRRSGLAYLPWKRQLGLQLI